LEHPSQSVRVLGVSSQREGVRAGLNAFVVLVVVVAVAAADIVAAHHDSLVFHDAVFDGTSPRAHPRPRCEIVLVVFVFDDVPPGVCPGFVGFSSESHRHRLCARAVPGKHRDVVAIRGSVAIVHDGSLTEMGDCSRTCGLES